LRVHRVLRVRVLEGSSDRAASLLRDDRSVRAVESFDHTVTAEIEGDDEDMARLLARLIGAGISVHSFAEEPLSLEDVFMMITKGIVN
jgi:ABC-2 type transport system ATP-binding protein